MKDVLIWRVGNGQQIRMWGDKWVNTPTTFTIQTPPSLLDEHATISELIDSNTKWWKLEFISSLFSPKEVTAILSTPISYTGQHNKQIWRGTMMGIFSVRSAYHLAMERYGKQRPKCSYRAVISPIWKVLWNLKIPNASKNFMWRACHNLLPTRDNLLRQKIVTNLVYSLCNSEAKLVLHILWGWPATRNL